MGQMAFGIAGAVVGAYFGNPALGYAIGSAIGGVVTPGPHTDGPRLNDKTLTTSVYGNPISRIYGTYPEQGEVIWALPIIEAAQEMGKGGEPSVTSYYYYGTFAVALCEGPIVGVRRVWANGLLVYDVSGSGNVVSGQPTLTGDGLGDLLMTIGWESKKMAAHMTVYTGSETQLPDPTMQANDPDTSAYRGTAYVVFNELPLEKFFNRFPQLKFEVVTTTAAAQTTVATLMIEAPPLERGLQCFMQGLVDYRASDAVRMVRSIDLDGYGNPTSFRAFNPTASKNGSPDSSHEMPRYPIAGDPASYIVAQNAVRVSSQREVYAFRGTGSSAGATYTNFVIRSARDGVLLPTGVFFNAFSLGPGFDNGISSIDHPVLAYNGAILTTNTAAPLAALSGRALNNGALVAQPIKIYLSDSRKIDIGMPVIDLFIESGFLYALIAGASSNAITLKVFDVSDGATAPLLYTIDFSDSRLNSASSNSIILYVAEGVARLVALEDGRGAADVFACNPSSGSTTFAHIVRLNAVDVNGPASGEGWVLGPGRSSSTPWAYCDASVCYVSAHTGALNNPTREGVIGFPVGSMALGRTTVAHIVETECALAGLSADKLDTSEITESIDGYRISGRSSARQNIEPLIGYSFFDAVEIDHKVTFPVRNRSASVTIPEDDMGAVEEHSNVDTAVELTRIQEMELPQEVSVTYANGLSQYANAAQYARRLVTKSTKKSDVQMPIAMSAQKAAESSGRLLYQAWTGRNKAKFSVGPKWSHLMPSDAVYVEQNGEQIPVRLLHRDETPTGVITFQAESLDARVITQTVGVIPDAVVSPTMTYNGPMNTRLLDLPLLRDSDDTDAPISYAAPIAGVVDFGAGNLYASDDGAAYTQAATFNSATIVGHVADAMPSFANGGYFFDDAARVVVQFFAPVVLASVTRSQALSLSVNAALIGDEIVIFQNATLTGGTTSAPIYTLSRILRGQRGTEAAIGSHVAGEDFLLLNAKALRQVKLTRAELGAPRHYKSVSFGRSLQNAVDVQVTTTYGGLRPLSPVHVFAGLTGAGDLVVQWQRRSRIDQAWRDYGEPALGESVEAYDVEIWSGSTLKRTISASTQTATFTAAMLALDFTTFPAPYEIRVYQLSSVVGRSLPGVFTQA